jgi:peptide/nickel transport system substrate-binding protein
VVGAAVALLALFAGAWQLFLACTTVVPAAGGRYVEAALGQPTTLNPLLAADAAADHVWLPLLFAGLTRVEPDGRVVPDLAERWERSADGRTYTFVLREHLRWSDGSPLTAADVVFTYEALRDPTFPADADRLAPWRELQVEALDDRTVRIVLPRPWAAFPEAAALGLVPRARLAGTRGTAWLTHPFNLDPIGAGPYRLLDLTAQEMVLAPNPYYHGRAPYLAELRFRFYSDLATAQAALQAGAVDGLAAVGQPLAPPPGVPVVSYAHPDYSRVTILWLDTTAPPFDERAVRLAVAHAIDRERLVGEVPGAAAPAWGPLPPNSWAATAGAWPSYAPDRARALLDGAGWRATAGGERQRQGRPLAISLVTNPDAGRQRAAEAVARDLRAVGFRVEVVLRPWDELAREELAGGRFQALLGGYWTPRRDPDLLRDLWSTEGAANLAGWHQPRADELLAQGAASDDPATRLEAYRAFQALWAAELPSVPLYYPLSSWLAPSRLQGIEPAALTGPAARLAQLPDWYLRTGRVLRGW